MVTSRSSDSVRDSLDRLSAGAMDWLGHNLDFFDPYSENSRSSEHRKAKAALELALLHHCWARLHPGDDRLAYVAELIDKLWQLPDFQHLVTAQPDNGGSYELIYTALAPAGSDDKLRKATIALLESGGYLSTAGKSWHMRLETRFYADKAGIRHEIEPYEELIEQSLLIQQPTTRPVTDQEAYTITHTSFYVSDFGFMRPRLDPDSAHRAVNLVSQILDHCAQQDKWDLTAELLIALSCLGSDPLDLPSGAAGIACLTRAQLPNGAIPGRSPALRAQRSASAGEFFSKSYHTTTAVILMSLIVSAGR